MYPKMPQNQREQPLTLPSLRKRGEEKLARRLPLVPFSPACGEKVPGRADEGQYPLKQDQPTISSVHCWFSQSDFVW